MQNNAQNIIKNSIKLDPQSRYIIAETILKSLNLPDKNLDDLWIKESVKRLNAYKQGKLKTLTYKQVFK